MYAMFSHVRYTQGMSVCVCVDDVLLCGADHEFTGLRGKKFAGVVGSPLDAGAL